MHTGTSRLKRPQRRWSGAPSETAFKFRSNVAFTDLSALGTDFRCRMKYVIEATRSTNPRVEPTDAATMLAVETDAVGAAPSVNGG